jgi:hypothetical protein
MLISLAVVPVSTGVWISSITDDDLAAFGKPQTTGFGSHLIRVSEAEEAAGLLTFERRDALLIRRGRTPEAVLFEWSGARIITVTGAVVRPHDVVYWVTVGAGRQGNFEIGMQNGLWGVPREYADALKRVKPGHKVVFYGRDVGFALCEVRSDPFYEQARVWPDGDYPYRVKVTPPLRRNEAQEFSKIYRHLRDRNGRPYDSPQAAGRAIGGRGGVFRILQPTELAGLLPELGWQ